MIYPLVSSTWGAEELAAVRAVCDSGRFTMGDRVSQFEREFASYFGSKFAVMVNSGSSANLLAVAAQFFRQQRPLQRGDEVIVPAVSWSTTYYPLCQYGLKLRFVDIDPQTFNLDVRAVERAVGPATRAVFAVNLLGCPSDLRTLSELCEARDLILLEDNCESMGAKLDARFTGTFGICGTFSTFFSHHICTMEGGLITTDDEEQYHLLKSLRAHGWTRDLPAKNWIHNKSGNEFEDHYSFVIPGYNVRPLEIEAAVGSVQLRKLSEFIRVRRENATYLIALLRDMPELQIQKHIGESSWFAFAFVLRGSLRGKRAGLVGRLSSAGIECRPVVAGNFCKNPVMKYFNFSAPDELRVADNVDENGFYIGNHHIPLNAEIEKFVSVVHDCIAQERDM